MAGMWNFDGRPVDREFLGKLGDSIGQYGPDGGGEYLQNFAGTAHAAYWAENNDEARQRKQLGMEVRGSLAMIYRAFPTNKESRLEHQPYVSRRGNVMTWDGRLDNRAELISALSHPLAVEHHGEQTDAAIVMAAWEAWGTECFKRLIGDFSLAVWEPSSRTLTMAKDFIGVRYLYYEVLLEGTGGTWERYPYLTPESGAGQPLKGPCVWWCSRLEPLILYSGRQYEINEEYIAGYFAFHPANHLTPYVGVDALPAGHYVQIRKGQKKLVQYWHFDPDKRIRYKTDTEYEEHFRQVFFQSVKRRLRSDSPIVAGLSGGRDSSAIVCVADEIIAKGESKTPRLDTYSRYAEDEPFQDDYRYLTIVEQKRGRTGHHITSDEDVISPTSVSLRGEESNAEGPLVYLAPSGATATKRLRPLDTDYFSAHRGISYSGAEGILHRMRFMKANGYRIILSGIGGDEVTGGVPYCVSELADLLVQWRFARMATQLRAWALAQKRTCRDLLWNTIRSLRPDFVRRSLRNRREALHWLDPQFVHRRCETFMRSCRVGVPGEGLPSFKSRVSGTMAVSWQLASVAKLHWRGAKHNCYERGFPFLDLDFLEFMFAIPRDQVLRPGQYRSLMRRALATVVPDEILNRTRKAFALRRPALGLQSIAHDIEELFTRPISANLGYVNRDEFLKCVGILVEGKNDLVIPIKRTVTLEMWLRSLVERGMLKGASAPSENRNGVLEGVA